MTDTSRVEAGELAETRMTVNGVPVVVRLPARVTLADALRDHLGLTGTHLGCEHGICGMCTVLVDGAAARACLLFACQLEGADIVTVEGLGRPGELHPLQEAFIERDGFQCGFCTSGQIMSGVAVIEEAKAGRPSAATADVTKPFTIEEFSNAEIRERMSGNLCRCACYPNIVAAVADAAGGS